MGRVSESHRPPFFIVGAPRSGTGLLRNLLRSHPRLAIPGESHFIPGFYLGYGEPRSRRAVRRMARRILAQFRVRRWELELEPADFDDCRTYAEIVSRLYGAFAARQGAERWGDKTPQYAAHMWVLARIFPEARFVHIVRDGRDAALSILRMSFGPDGLGAAARQWRELVRRARSDGEALGPERYLEIRYEDLVGDPIATMRRVCEFLGEPFDERVLSPTANPRWPKLVYNLPRDGKPRNVSDVAIVTGNAGKWKRLMPAADQARFESVAGDLLAELGYETTTSGSSVPVVVRPPLAARVRGVRRYLAQQLDRPNKSFWFPSELALRWAWIRARLRGAGDRSGYRSRRR